MRFYKPSVKPMPWHYKLLGFGVVLCLLFLGLVGLVLPILPGIVFLFLAFFVLTKISRRAAAYAHSKPWFNYHMQHLRAANGLSFGARCKLAGLMAVRGLVDSVAAGAIWCKRHLTR